MVEICGFKNQHHHELDLAENSFGTAGVTRRERKKYDVDRQRCADYIAIRTTAFYNMNIFQAFGVQVNRIKMLSGSQLPSDKPSHIRNCAV